MTNALLMDSTIQSVIDYNDININELEYLPPKKNNIGYYVFIRNNNKEIIINTPYLLINKSKKIDDNYYFLELIIDSQVKDFFSFITEIEDDSILKIHENCNSWFGNNMNIDILDEYHKPCIKMKSNGLGILKIKIKDTNYNNKIDDNRVSLRLKLNGIKFLKQQFCLDWIFLGFNTNYELNKLDNLNFEFINNKYSKIKLKDNNYHQEEQPQEEQHQEEQHQEEQHQEEQHQEEQHQEEQHQEEQHQEEQHQEEQHQEEQHQEEQLKINRKEKKVNKKKKKKIIYYANKRRIWN